MKKHAFLMVLPFVAVPFFLQAQQGSIYHEGWIDFNKNGKKDIYEDAGQPIESRVSDLISQMNTDEKDLPDGNALWIRPCAERRAAHSAMEAKPLERWYRQYR